MSPLDFEYYQAEKANDQAHIDYLKNNTIQSKSFKYMKIIFGTMPWTPPVNCMPNPNATAYGYLQNFPTPVPTQNEKYYDEAFWYQENGNFYTLNRNNNTGQRMQQLYSYQSGTNKLTQASFQFTTGTPEVYTYPYDANGNLTADPRKSISTIGYSLYNDLPVSMTNNSGEQKYRYFGGKRSVKENSATDREYYIDQVILDQNGTVKSYQTAVGYATPGGAYANYFYQVKDWLGSPHITLSSNGTIQNAIDYYSFGKLMPARQSFSTNQEGYRYQFTGHEKDGGTTYQYHGARYYDEELARYISVDRYAMKFFHQSPYVYAGNMPINSIDVNGDYTEDVARAMAERGRGNKYTTSVVENPNKKGDYGVNYIKTVKGIKYEGVQFEGKFKGIVGGDLKKLNSGDQKSAVPGSSDPKSGNGPTTSLTGANNTSNLQKLISQASSMFTFKVKTQEQEEFKIIDGAYGDKLSIVNFAGQEKTLHQGKYSVTTTSITKTHRGGVSYSVGTGPITFSQSGTVTTIKTAIPFTNTTFDLGAGVGYGLGELQIGNTTTYANGTFGGSRMVMRPGGGVGTVVLGTAMLILTDGAAAPIVLPMLRKAF